MDQKTRIVLSKINPQTRHIEICNDASLTGDDIVFIASKVEACPGLESLTIKSCPTTAENAWGDALAPVLGRHPTLSRFVLINHGTKTTDFALKVVGQNKKIGLMSFSDSSAISQTKYATLLELIATSDLLTNLTLPFDPSDSGGGAWGKNKMPLWLKRCKNLISIQFTESYHNWDKTWIEGCAKNRQAAVKLIEKVRKKDFKTVDEIMLLNERIPAVIAVGTEEKTRDQTLLELQALNDFLIQKFGTSIGLELYINSEIVEAVEEKALVVVKSSALSELPTIELAAQQVSLLSAEAIRQQLEGGKDSPALLMKLGQETVGAISAIALASLNEATAPTSAAPPLRSMADFLDRLGAAKSIISGQTPLSQSQELSVATSQTKPRRKKTLFTWFSGGEAEPEKEEQPEEKTLSMRTLADAGQLAREAGQILQNTVPSLTSMEDDLTNQVIKTRQIVDAYRKVSEQLCLIRTVGHDVLAQWQAEKAESASTESGPLFAEQRETPFHIQALTARLEFLSQIQIQAEGHAASHITQAAVAQKQLLCMVGILGQNIPIMAEGAAAFIKDVMALERAGTIDAIASVTRGATETTGNSTRLLSAMTTLAAIENLVSSTQDALLSMSTQAQDVADHLNGNAALEPSLPVAKDRLGAPSTVKDEAVP